MENETVPASLTEVVLSRDAIASALEVANVAFETALPSVVEKIPVLSAFVSAIGGVFDIRSKLLIKKLASFLTELREVSDEDRWAFRRELERDPALREKVGEHLIMLLDRLDSTEKARLIGKLFSAFLRRRLTFEEFQLTGAGVDRAHLADILVVARSSDALYGDAGSRLFSAGLATLQVSSLNDMPQLGALGRGIQSYPLNDTGKMLLAVCFSHYEAEQASRNPKQHSK
jgi:hypothetical protein